MEGFFYKPKAKPQTVDRSGKGSREQYVDRSGKSDKAMASPKPKAKPSAPPKPKAKPSAPPKPKAKPSAPAVKTTAKPANKMTFQQAVRRNMTEEYIRQKLAPKRSLFGSLFGKKGK